MRGIITSRTIRSGTLSIAFWMASTPSLAVRTRQLSRSRIRRVRFRKSGSSSTTRIRGASVTAFPPPCPVLLGPHDLSALGRRKPEQAGSEAGVCMLPGKNEVRDVAESVFHDGACQPAFPSTTSSTSRDRSGASTRGRSAMLSSPPAPGTRSRSSQVNSAEKSPRPSRNSSGVWRVKAASIG